MRPSRPAAVRVHAVAERGYGSGAAAYERGRPDYPPEALAAMAERLDLRPGREVLEIGAGTGKLTRGLVDTGARVTAVEPIAAMRERLALAAPSATVLEGTAELLPLPNASVDAVVVGQAFHWFDTIRALSECHRVLRPGGRLALAWNLRNLELPWLRAVVDLASAAGERPPQYGEGAWRAAFARCALFAPLETAELPWALETDHAGVVDWVASMSQVAALEPDDRATVLERVATLLATHPDTAARERLAVPFRTELWWAERRPGARETADHDGTRGIVASVNTSPGGVPKRPVDHAWAGRDGVEGDGHVYPGHGGADAAVCLLAQEAIERVRGDGHELFPGAVGENATLLGIDWAALRPGDRLAFGSGLELELTKCATPCQTIAHWFAERRIARLGEKQHPEDARWYARVLAEGLLEPGDTVVTNARRRRAGDTDCRSVRSSVLAARSADGRGRPQRLDAIPAAASVGAVRTSTAPVPGHA
jgi:MOSC domain-containing protein YiiM/SAM-dependent methyltransferase